MRKRLTLILLAAAALVLVLLLSRIQESDLLSINVTGARLDGQTIDTALETPALTASSVSGSRVETLLVKPRYTGQDTAGNTWQLTADKADQSSTVGPDGKSAAKGALGGTILLTNVQAGYTAASETEPFAFTAKQGAYTHASSTVVLTDDVILTGRGIKVETPTLTANLTSRTAAGDQGVVVTGASGGYDVTLTGNTFTVNHASGTLTVTGNVKAHLMPH